jgi:hypothetical protein
LLANEAQNCPHNSGRIEGAINDILGFSIIVYILS